MASEIETVTCRKSVVIGLATVLGVIIIGAIAFACISGMGVLQFDKPSVAIARQATDEATDQVNESATAESGLPKDDSSNTESPSTNPEGEDKATAVPVEGDQSTAIPAEGDQITATPLEGDQTTDTPAEDNLETDDS